MGHQSKKVQEFDAARIAGLLHTVSSPDFHFSVIRT
jgi:hypothetical protein